VTLLCACGGAEEHEGKGTDDCFFHCECFLERPVATGTTIRRAFAPEHAFESMNR
jgi:hypothetical protein